MLYSDKAETTADMFLRVLLLDHGYMEFVEHWGSDERIIEAARMSTGKGFLGWNPGPCGDCNGTGFNKQWVNRWAIPPSFTDIGPTQLTLQSGCREKVEKDMPCPICNGKGQLQGDAKLQKFLWTHKHGTPFEMAGMTCVAQAPIMVFREWHRHRTQSYNEMSARYIPLPAIDYVPTTERCMIVVNKNKQAGLAAGADELTHEKALEWLELLAKGYEMDEAIYQYGLKLGIPKELARLKLSVGRYSRMMASTDLRNWLAFLTLRMDVNAQWEIRQYANQVGVYIKKLFPQTWALFVEGKPYA